MKTILVGILIAFSVQVFATDNIRREGVQIRREAKIVNRTIRYTQRKNETTKNPSKLSNSSCKFRVFEFGAELVGVKTWINGVKNTFSFVNKYEIDDLLGNSQLCKDGSCNAFVITNEDLKGGRWNLEDKTMLIAGSMKDFKVLISQITIRSEQEKPVNCYSK